MQSAVSKWDGCLRRQFSPDLDCTALHCFLLFFSLFIPSVISSTLQAPIARRRSLDEALFIHGYEVRYKPPATPPASKHFLVYISLKALAVR